MTYLPATNGLAMKPRKVSDSLSGADFATEISQVPDCWVARKRVLLRSEHSSRTLWRQQSQRHAWLDLTHRSLQPVGRYFFGRRGWFLKKATAEEPDSWVRRPLVSKALLSNGQTDSVSHLTPFHFSHLHQFPIFFFAPFSRRGLRLKGEFVFQVHWAKVSFLVDLVEK